MAKESNAASDKAEKPHVVTAGEVAERLAKMVVKKESSRPSVDASVVESVARGMMEFGYEFTAETVNVLADYLRGYNLWMCGSVGVGKTFFFDCMNGVRDRRGFDEIVKLSMIETQGWTMEDARNWADETRDYDVLIDDVGTEPLMKSWGQEAELFPYLLEKRMQLSRRRTHLTSNLSIVGIKKRYSERVSDRFVQFFKMELMNAKKSRRVLRPWKMPKDSLGVI